MNVLTFSPPRRLASTIGLPPFGGATRIAWDTCLAPSQVSFGGLPSSGSGAGPYRR
jgi:hypothetical protein